MNHTTHTAAAQGVPQVAESIDFTDELSLFGDVVEVTGARRIRRNGFYNKRSRRPAGGRENYALKAESPVLVKLVDGTVAVASAEGLAAYLARTGQSA